MAPIPTWFQKRLSLNPWVWFLIFAAANSLLSFYPCPLQTKLLILLFGLVLPLVVAFKTSGGASGPTAAPEKKETPLSFHWVFTLFFILVTVNRLTRLDSLPPWPLSDEGYEGALGISLLSRWDWRLLWSPIPHEPLLDWMLGLYFHCVTPSLFSFRLFSALISLATVAAAYWGARSFLSQRLSFLFALTLAFSYWGLVLSRLGNVAILIPLWACLAFGCLGQLLKAETRAGRWAAGAGLIACNLLGFYSWTNWAGIALGLTWVMIVYGWKNARVTKTYLLVYGALLGAALAPLVFARLAPGGMAHWDDLAGLSFLKAALYNLVGLLWDGSASFPYGSLWGGFFNPLLDSLTLMGMLFFFQRADRRARWVWPLVFLFSLLPALLASGDVELLRALPLMVFLTLAAAAGLEGLLALKGSRNLYAAALLLILSFGMDAWNFHARYADPAFAPEKHQATVMAYAEVWHYLKAMNRESGPLYVFNTFTTDFNNRTLDIALYPFNVLQNPALDAAQPKWAALIVHPDYERYFEKNYSHKRLTRWGEKGSIELVMIPVADISAATLERWKKADGLFREVNLAWLKKSPTANWLSLTDPMARMPFGWRDDPFLHAVTDEKLGYLVYLDKNFDSASLCYKEALKTYPAPHLYYDLGLCRKALGQNAEGDKDFEEARRLAEKQSGGK